MPEYTKSIQQKKMGRSKSTMEYSSGQYATVTHYRRGGQDRGYQTKDTQNLCPEKTLKIYRGENKGLFVR